MVMRSGGISGKPSKGGKQHVASCDECTAIGPKKVEGRILAYFRRVRFPLKGAEVRRNDSLLPMVRLVAQSKEFLLDSAVDRLTVIWRN